eukprot:m.33810 g.33810  ORF g.33810 m.33810 type:complete len:827 (-) comp8606_c0_seq2:94-2574(-)
MGKKKSALDDDDEDMEEEKHLYAQQLEATRKAQDAATRQMLAAQEAMLAKAKKKASDEKKLRNYVKGLIERHDKHMHGSDFEVVPEDKEYAVVEFTEKCLFQKEAERLEKEVETLQKVQAENEELRKTVSEQNNTIAEFKEMVPRLEKENARMKKELTENEKELEEMRNKQRKLVADREEALQEIERLKKELEKLRKMLEDQEGDLKANQDAAKEKYLTEIAEKQDLVDKLQKDLGDAKKEKENEEDEKNALQRELAAIQKENEEKSAQLAAEKSKINQHDDEAMNNLRDMKLQLTEAQAGLEAAQIQEQVLRRKIKDLEDEATAEHDSSKAAKGELKDAKKEIEDAEERIGQLERELELLRQDGDRQESISREAADLKNTAQEAKSKARDLERDLEECRENCEDLERKNKGLTKRANEADEELEETRATNRNLRRELAAAMEKIDALTAERDALLAKLAHLQGDLDENAQETDGELVKAKERIRAVKADLDEMKEEMEEKAAENERLKKKNEALVADKERLMKENGPMRGSAARQASSRAFNYTGPLGDGEEDEFDALNATRLGNECLYVAQNQIKLAQDELENSIRELEAKDRELEAIHAQLNQAMIRNQTIEAQLANSLQDNEELLILRERNAELQAQVKAQSTELAMCASQQDQIALLRAELAEALEELATLRDTIKGAKKPSRRKPGSTEREYEIELEGWENHSWHAPHRHPDEEVIPVNTLPVALAKTLRVVGPKWFKIGQGKLSLLDRSSHIVLVEWPMSSVVRYAEDPDAIWLDFAPQDSNLVGELGLATGVGMGSDAFNKLNRAMRPYIKKRGASDN